MIIVLSPAKSLDFETPYRADALTQPAFLDDSRKLVERLRRLSADDLAALMELSDKLAELNVARYRAWSTPFTPQNAKPALLAFDGDVYDGFAAKTLTPAGLAFAQQHLRILSGLYGLLRPLDLIQPYRLEMGRPLANPRGKDLYAFWGGRLTEAVNAALEESAAPALINLASAEYFRALQPKKLARPVIQPVFEDWSGGRFKVVSFHAKRARGLLARHAIGKKLRDPQALKKFAGEGYAFAPEASSETTWVFRRRSAGQ